MERMTGVGVAFFTARDPKSLSASYGRFAWIMELEESRIEFWEPPQSREK